MTEQEQDRREALARFIDPTAFDEWPVPRPDVQAAAQAEAYRQADVWLASDWLAEVVREAKREAWDEAFGAGQNYEGRRVSPEPEDWPTDLPRNPYARHAGTDQ